MSELVTEPMQLNIGPAHPATHGALRFYVELDGETIKKSTTEIGYLHRAFEKHSEVSTWSQVIPYTDRLNYCSSLMNNVGYCKAVEELLGISIPERAVYIRVIVSELARIMDHLICVGTSAVDLGALTNFWYFFNVREQIYDFTEKLCGARLTTNYTRIGGVMRDLTPGFQEGIKKVLKDLDKAILEVNKLLERNRIFMDRTQGVGVISKDDAIAWGFTGPCLRATGVPHDLRKAEPYYHYDEFDFEIPVGTAGDCYDRLMVRVEEMRQSAKIVEQALQRIPDGPVIIQDPKVALPPKEKVYGSIEGLMNHFMLLTDGIHPPKGQIYSATEAANGELGFLIVSDGGPRPYRIHCRPPCFPIASAFDKMAEKGMIADAIAVLGGLNIVVGELDR